MSTTYVRMRMSRQVTHTQHRHNKMRMVSSLLLRVRPSLVLRRTVIGTSHTTHAGDEVFVSKMAEENRKGIAVLSFNRFEARNSISRQMAKQLLSNLDQLIKDADLRILIIRSVVPGVFCAGADLKERLSMNQYEIPPFVARLRAIANAIHDFPVPTIAAIDGAAIGGGLEYALAADLRVASDNSRMGLVETKLAVIPGAGGTQRLPRLIPVHIAKELIYTGRLIDGRDALKYGLVNYCVEQNGDGDAAYRRAVQLAEEILPNGPVALKQAKNAINRGIEVDLVSGLAIEASGHTICVGTKDRIEGLLSFKEKRPPKYGGE